MPKYTNALKDKKCPVCGDWFKGDETTGTEPCPKCTGAIRCVKCEEWITDNEDTYNVDLCEECADELVLDARDNGECNEGDKCPLCDGKIQTRGLGQEHWIVDCDKCGYMFSED